MKTAKETLKAFKEKYKTELEAAEAATGYGEGPNRNEPDGILVRVYGNDPAERDLRLTKLREQLPSSIDDVPIYIEEMSIPVAYFKSV